MKKRYMITISFILTIVMMTGCRTYRNDDLTVATEETVQDEEEESYNNYEGTDLELVENKGRLSVGVAEFDPMSYMEDGQWKGFDVDMAKAFADEMAVDIDFVDIDIENKLSYLESREVDCIWSGITLADDVMDNMDYSLPYCTNSQVVVINKEDADEYKTMKKLSKLDFSVKLGSTAEQFVKKNKFKYSTFIDFEDSINDVEEGNSDAAIVDYIYAFSKVGKGRQFEDLTMSVRMSEEKYVIAFRKNSSLCDRIDQFMTESYENGLMAEIAKKYGLEKMLIIQ